MSPILQSHSMLRNLRYFVRQLLVQGVHRMWRTCKPPLFASYLSKERYMGEECGFVALFSLMLPELFKEPQNLLSCA